ncbi:MAG: large-conductance mechanosensitive channel protein MscL [Bacteroidetes bacterium]|nr:MAG: large-conductance mechanosensitive channel protein MscL [Bacteroidota bacterium]
MLKEFKKFISRGNVIELAVGLIMALYFGAIIKSLVDHIIMPPIGLLLGNVDFSELKIVLQEAVVREGTEVPEVAISIGLFLNTIITFLIVAFAVFLVIQGYNRFKARFEKKEAAVAPPPVPSNEEVLLAEIRDLLKKQSAPAGPEGRSNN